MKTIQITIDEQLLDSVDQAVSELGATRSAFIRDALQWALQRAQTRRLEEQHATGYRIHPVTPGEFDGWDQQWGDA
jgi:metal-responsive CopG/Arc/MetJ family transcriptional regulator